MGKATKQQRTQASGKALHGRKRALAVIGLLSASVVVILWFLLPVRNPFGQFPSTTKAEAVLESLLRGKDEAIDLALANWLVAADVPQFSGLTREAYFSQLNEMVEVVRRETARMEGVARSRGQNPNDPGTRCAIFCNAVLKLRFAYAEEFRQRDLTPGQRKALYGDANHILLAGLLQTRRGTCVSMPLLYLVIGQRLGYPVHLVAIGSHYFIRWEEPGYRLNIETTSVEKVRVSEQDESYLETEGLTRDQIKGSELRNLTRREVVGQLLFARSGHWMFRQETSPSRGWMDLSRARHLSPDDPAIKLAHEGIFSRYGIGPSDTLATLHKKETQGPNP